MKAVRFLLGSAGVWLGMGSMLAQETRLANLAIRAPGGGGETLITGFTIGAGPSKTVLVRAIGPTLEAFGVGGALADPKLEIFSGADRIAENDNWRVSDASAFAAVGAFPLGAESRDAAIVTTLVPGSYTVQVSGLGTERGVALIEVYEVTGGATRLVNLSTRAQVGAGSDILVPGITIAPGAGTRRLLIRAVGPTLGEFGVDGALADPKLELYAGSTRTAENDNWGSPVGFGAASEAALQAAFTQAGAFGVAAGSKDAALLVNLGSGSYTLQVSGVNGATGAALVELYDLTPVNQTGARPNSGLYLATLRPESGAPTSTGSGLATLIVNPDGTARVSVSYSNLSAEPTNAFLALGPGRDYVMNLPLGQVRGAVWNFDPSGPYTTNDLIQALNAGNISVVLGSANAPAGELVGRFGTAAGSRTFVPPAAPPPLPSNALTNPTRGDAARLLTQATFGPTLESIDEVVAKGIPAWISEQIALPPSLHLPLTRADVAAFPNLPNPAGFQFVHDTNRRAAWWKVALTGRDQLRQRVAFALSQFFVVSIYNGLGGEAEALAQYYDLLVRNAFGDFRQLLEEVALSPAMGMNLSHLGNAKADPVRGTMPDENFARELHQLFTVGLVQLHPDGTLQLDADGEPIPTYDQGIVMETARLLTGWAFANASVSTSTTQRNQFLMVPAATQTAGAPNSSGWLNAMAYYDAFHDRTEKRIISAQQVSPSTSNRTVVPAGRSGPEELKVLLDTLVAHPNTGPFFCRRMIQRLVTSNPSPGYVHRVARIFADDGTGRRGNIAAVVRAILTDFEARSLDVRSHAGYGKLKEPILRGAELLRMFGATAPNGRYADTYPGEFGNDWGSSSLIWPEGTFNQGPLLARTVFNFFSPEYNGGGLLAAAGLVAPELEIIDSYFAVVLPSVLMGYVNRDPATLPAAPAGGSPRLIMNFDSLLSVASSPQTLLDRLSLLLCGDQLSVRTRERIMNLLNQRYASATDLQRVRIALQVVLAVPDSAVQR